MALRFRSPIKGMNGIGGKGGEGGLLRAFPKPRKREFVDEPIEGTTE
jgi:hypothetical protein